MPTEQHTAESPPITWTVREIPLGDMFARYRHDPETGKVDLLILPQSLRCQVVQRREFLEGIDIDAYTEATGNKIPAEKLDALVQVKEVRDDYSSGFAHGHTLRNSGTISRLRLSSFEVERSGTSTIVNTILTHMNGWSVHHQLFYTEGQAYAESRVLVKNTGSNPIELELLSSFSFGGITPFSPDYGSGRLVLHRFRSSWSMEGRLESRAVEDLQLEPSWAGWGVRCERFGCVGSMPVNQFFPFLAIEDQQAGATWAAKLESPGSWQMEVYRREDGLALSGGLADREFGHWCKKLLPGEEFQSPGAFLTCVEGGIDEASNALLNVKSVKHSCSTNEAPRETGLPVIVNEWATSWGRPTHEAVVALAEKVSPLGAQYLVIDAGWFAPSDIAWGNAHGDWIPSAEHYPQGLKATADAIRARGMVPGLWFEMETCGEDSRFFTDRTDLLLHRDGRPLTVGTRRFLDFRKREVIDYLSSRVIGTLKECGFGYLKVDYNETLGIGVDGAESLGEGLRQHLEGVQAFFQKIRTELPALVIENCSSGGHRLEPSFFGLTEMSSFSDAHESLEIPVLAANLIRLVPFKQSQIWVVLRKGEPHSRTCYSLAAGFLGRLCLSGDLLAMSEEQDTLVRKAVMLYQKCEQLLLHGTWKRFGPFISQYRDVQGWQGVTCTDQKGERVLLVAHHFGGSEAEEVEIPLPAGHWAIKETLNTQLPLAQVEGSRVRIKFGSLWQGQVLLLESQ